MNKFAKYFVVPMLCLASNLAMAANIKDYPRVAVMDFGNKAIMSRGLRGHDMAMATEYAIYQLSACGWFDLIDYESLNAIAQMHKINMSGFIDQGTAVQMGRIAGAQFMVIGNVTGLTTKENIAALRAHTANASNAQHVVNANVALRIVDIETGRIVVAGIGKGSSTSTLTEFGFTKYRTKENIRSKTVGNTVVNDIKDEIVTQRTRQNVNTRDTDNRNISDNSSNNYNRNDNFNASDRTNNSGSSSFNRSGGTNSGSSYVDRANQTGRASSEYNNRGYSEEQYDETKNYQDRIRDRSQQEYQNEDGRTKSGGSWGGTTKRHDDEWSEGGSSLNVSGGPAVGRTTGKNQHQEWDETIYNDKADWHRDSRGGEGHSVDSTDYNNSYYDKENGYSRGKANASRDYDRDTTERTRANDYKMDNRKITTNSQYDDTQTRSGSKSQYSNYNDRGNDQYQNRSQRDQNMNYDSNINQSSASNYSNAGDRSHAYNNDYEDAVANKANNRTSINTENKVITYDKEAMNYSIVIGTVEVSDVQVRNAISKAVRDAIYGKTGIMTTLNNGKPLKIKTGF